MPVGRIVCSLFSGSTHLKDLSYMKRMSKRNLRVGEIFRVVCAANVFNDPKVTLVQVSYMNMTWQFSRKDYKQSYQNLRPSFPDRPFCSKPLSWNYP
ncbi:MAG: hypothetical protein H7A37_04640 [Chlamydiales bacterium]|nr:hypothetical protein [Chlamydiia bacterium]MCP5507570.1 hypothetical protein [Chlamydiales bacterium]